MNFPKIRMISVLVSLLVVSVITLAGAVVVEAAINGNNSFSGIKTVFVIIMENTNWSNVKGNTNSAPYINSLLVRPDAAFANQYFNPPGVHPSEPNYVWLEAGQANDLPNGNNTVNFTTDNDPSSVNSTSSHDHLVSFLYAKGVSWRTYEEGINGQNCPLVSNSETKYVAKHNPFVFFQDVTGNNNPNFRYCVEHVRPFVQLADDLRNNTVAQYNFITPDSCDDMHDTKGCQTDDNVKNGDLWLSRHLPAILNSRSYRDGGVVFLTWDEGENKSDGPIGLVILSSQSKGRGYSNNLHYDHSSLLKTMAEIFQVKRLPGQSASAQDLSDLFRPTNASGRSLVPGFIPQSSLLNQIINKVGPAVLGSLGVVAGAIVAWYTLRKKSQVFTVYYSKIRDIQIRYDQLLTAPNSDHARILRSFRKELENIQEEAELTAAQRKLDQEQLTAIINKIDRILKEVA